MRFNALVGKVRHQGTQMLRTARNVSSLVDRHVHTAAHLYRHQVQPALRAAGLDRSDIDKQLKGNCDLYNQYSSMLNDGVGVVDEIARNLLG